MSGKITNRENVPFGRVITPSELGALFRKERKRRGLTLADVHDATGLSTRFLSEFERGKDNASLGRALRALTSLGLELLVFPRAKSRLLLRRAHRDDEDPS
jgi:transcriptional regulator with XRE-family HTH domain